MVISGSTWSKIVHPGRIRRFQICTCGRRTAALPLGHTLFDVTGDALAMVRGDQRPHFHACLRAVAHGQRLGPLGQQFKQRSGCVAHGDEHAARQTSFARSSES